MTPDYITDIILKDFQSHAHTTLHLRPGVNIITGSSDSGKTALLRGLRWVVENYPSGDAFRSWWSDGETSVTLVMKDGARIIRAKKGKNGNTYTVGDIDLEAFGKGVPDAVTEALRFRSINFQWQHDRLFLLDESPPEIARRLNEVARLEDIDISLSYINSGLNNAQAEKRRLAAARKEAEARVTELDWIEDAAKELTELQELQTAQRDMKERAEALRRILSQLSAAEESVNQCISLEDLDGAGTCLTELANEVRRFDGLGTERKELASILYTENRLATALESRKTEEQEAEKGLKALAGSRCPLCLGSGKVT